MSLSQHDDKLHQGSKVVDIGARICYQNLRSVFKFKKGAATKNTHPMACHDVACVYVAVQDMPTIKNIMAGNMSFLEHVWTRPCLCPNISSYCAYFDYIAVQPWGTHVFGNWVTLPCWHYHKCAGMQCQRLSLATPKSRDGPHQKNQLAESGLPNWIYKPWPI